MSPMWPCLLSFTCLVLSGLGEDNQTKGAGQCERPVGEKMVPADRQYYDAGKSLTVKCETGYRPSRETIKCTDRQTWDHYPRCIERCKKPSISNLEKISPSKEYYYTSEEVRLQCKPGYYPLSDRIQCTYNGVRDEWSPTAVCIEVKVTKKSVTPSSIILSIVCTPDWCGPTWASTLYTCVHHGIVHIECKYTAGDVTFSDLDPFTQYTITVYHIGQSWWPLLTLYITTPESAPDFVRTPSMEDGTIAWTWSNAQGSITGFQMNIVAWRDYNSSFSLNITEWFPPNITQYKMNLQHGTNYTFHLRGFTSAGGGKYKSTSVETPIGDVTGTSNSTRSSILNLDLASMLWLIVPISTVKLLVFVVLLKIQFSLIAGKTSETDLDRHEKPKEYRILYRKREEEFVSIQNGPDDNVYSDPKEAAHS